MMNRRSFLVAAAAAAFAPATFVRAAETKRRVIVVGGGLAGFRALTSFASWPGGVEELYPKLVDSSLEELSTVVEPFGSSIVGPPIDE